jgi:hypothetical protein
MFGDARRGKISEIKCLWENLGNSKASLGYVYVIFEIPLNVMVQKDLQTARSPGELTVVL